MRPCSASRSPVANWCAATQARKNPLCHLPSVFLRHRQRNSKQVKYNIRGTQPLHSSFPPPPFCVKLTAMGSKDKGKKEVKKAPKPKPKPEPGRRREGFTPAPPK